MLLSKLVGRCLVHAAGKSAKTQEHYEHVGNRLLSTIGNVDIINITPAHAADFVAGLLVSPNTKANYVRYAHAIFQRAVNEELIDRNPFRHESGAVIRPPKDWINYDDAAMVRILDACPSPEWRRLMGLCRWAGMRATEARNIRWSDIGNNWVASIAGKGGRVRQVPIEKRLQAMLSERSGDGPCDGLPRGSSLSSRASLIAKNAGFARSSPLHDMRRCRAQEWRREHGEFRASEWLGHSAVVAAAHYDRLEPSDFARVTAA